MLHWTRGEIRVTNKLFYYYPSVYKHHTIEDSFQKLTTFYCTQPFNVRKEKAQKNQHTNLRRTGIKYTTVHSIKAIHELSIHFQDSKTNRQPTQVYRNKGKEPSIGQTYMKYWLFKFVTIPRLISIIDYVTWRDVEYPRLL